MDTWLKLESITAYIIANSLRKDIWDVVILWDWFNKRVLGIQYASAVDSIAANIAEGFGRYHKKDKEKFYYNARGSVYEAQFWTQKTYERKLLTKHQYENLSQQLLLLPKELNWLIKITEEKLKQ